MAAGVVQQAGEDVTSWDEVQRRLGESGSASGVAANAIGASKLRIVAISIAWESPTLRTDGASGVVIAIEATSRTSRSGSVLVHVTDEIVSIVSFGLFVDHGDFVGETAGRGTVGLLFGKGGIAGAFADVDPTGTSTARRVEARNEITIVIISIRVGFYIIPWVEGVGASIRGV